MWTWYVLVESANGQLKIVRGCNEMMKMVMHAFFVSQLCTNHRFIVRNFISFVGWKKETVLLWTPIP